jgi:glycosyltransferase involved in cell wall biosynthesis
VRVLLLNSLDFGYGSTYRARELARALEELGHDVAYVESNADQAAAAGRGAPVRRVRSVRQSPGAPGFLAGTLERAGLAALARCDVAYVQKFIPLTAPAMLLLRARGIRLVVDWDDRDTAFQRTTARRWLTAGCEAGLPRLAHHITTHNEGLAAHARRVSGRPVTLVPLTVDTALFDPALLDREGERARRGLSNAFVVGHLCTFTEGGARDLDRVVSTAARILAARADARFLLVGGPSGPIEQKVRALIAGAGIAARSQVVDMGERADVPKHLTCMDVALLHMRPDAGSEMRVSLKLLEYLAMGLAVAGNAEGASRPLFERFGVTLDPARVDAGAIVHDNWGSASSRSAARAFVLEHHGRQAAREALARVFPVGRPGGVIDGIRTDR